MFAHGAAVLTQGLLLGISSGATCLATCAPVLVPLLLSEARSTRGNGVVMAEFLAGRLGGYLVFGSLSWLGGRLLLGGSPLGGAAAGLVSLGLGALMLGHGALKFAGKSLPVRPHAACAVSPWRARTWLHGAPQLLPLGLGLFSGLSLCPPLVVALTQGALNRSLLESLLFFACFFAGTSLFFAPIPLLGAFRRHQALVPVGCLAAVVVGLYYLYSGALACFFPSP